MSAADLATYRKAFNRLDADGNGKITNNELAKLFKQFGHNPTDDEIANIIQEVDKDNNGTIDFEEFCELANRYKYILISEGNFRAIFDQMDKNGDGCLTKEEFGNALRELGREPTEKELQEIVTLIDSNGDGEITYEEFERHWLSMK